MNDAFVIVSADDIAHQILGYSLSKNWPVSKDGTIELPAHIKSFFDDLASQIEAAIDTEPKQVPDEDWTDSRSRSPMRAPTNLPDSVGPLLTTTWDQGQYYNALCPKDENGPDGHVYTGCIATAMAQIIKYWSAPNPGLGTHTFETNYGELTVNYESSTYDFDNMPSILTESCSQQQISEVAKLMYNCCVAANMNYGATESNNTYNDLVDANNAWVDANNANGQYRHWMNDTTNVNGGYPIFAPLYIDNEQENSNISDDEVGWDNNSVSSNKAYSDKSAIYDLTGMKIETNDINALPSGIYISNERKILINVKE
ncbi:MAG: C10 family peptidase [Bacteroidaceae bacterium]|nr:C10 family peptidase [Bacteroidaceae bacterium]